MEMLLQFSPLLAPLAAAALALLAIRQPGPRPGLVLKAVGPVSVLGLVGAAGLVASLVLGPSTTPLLGGEGLGFSLRLDALSAVMLTMVALLAVVVLRFSATYLDGDERQGVFLGRLGWTIAAVELLVMAGNLATFVPAWIATSLALHQLLLFYPERPGAVFAARKKFIVARMGDAALIGAAVLLYSVFETGDLATILTAVEGPQASAWQVSAAGVLLAGAAILKSAQFPTHGWLVEVMETPTPVSALLHAGILNAGPFLALRYGSVLQQSVAASATLVVVGGLTALLASVVLLTQPSIKVALGYSSAAHMGFMLLVCGLGVFPAAALHLVAHSFYKAHAFLSSGSVIETARAAVPVQLAQGSAAKVAASLLGALGLYVGVAWALGLRPDESPALLVVGAILVLGITQLIGSSIAVSSAPGALLRGAGLAGAVTLAFFFLEEGARLLLLGALPEPQLPAAAVLALSLAVLGSFALAIALQLMPLRRSSFVRAAYVHLRNGLYVNTLFDRMVGALRRQTQPGCS